MTKRDLYIYGTNADAQQGDAAGAEAFDAAQAALDATQDPPGQDALEQNLGNAVVLPPPTLAAQGVPQSLVYATFEKAMRCTLMLQADQFGVVVTIHTTISGRARFKRSFPLLPTTVPRTVRLFGKSIEVTVQTISAASIGGAPSINVVGAILTDEVDPLGELWTTWTPGTEISGALAAAGQCVPLQGAANATQGGCLLGAQGSLQGAPTPGASYWLMFFDASAAPAHGATPLVAIGPLVPAANGAPASSYSFDRSLRADVFFSQGLYYALSQTGDFYTAITDGATVRVDFDWGT